VTGADPLTAALAVASRYVALDPGLVADVKRAVAIAAGGAFDAVLGFEAWAQASSATKPEVARAIRSRS
jgi:enoyl-CoA hydratase